MAYDPNQQYQQQPQYPPPGYQQPYQQQGYQQYPPPGYQQPAVVQNPVAAQLGPSSIGIDANIAAAISYLWPIGLVFFLIEKKNRFVRFHAFQSLAYVALSIVVSIFYFLDTYFFVFGCLGGLLSLAWLVGAILAGVQAYQGKWFKLPVVGDMAYNNAMSWVPPEGGPGGVPPVMNTQYPPQQPGGYPPSGQYPPQPPPTYPQQ